MFIAVSLTVSRSGGVHVDARQWSLDIEIALRE
jgi:hypothetical protein